jgi:hypothetical protein
MVLWDLEKRHALRAWTAHTAGIYALLASGDSVRRSALASSGEAAAGAAEELQHSFLLKGARLQTASSDGEIKSWWLRLRADEEVAAETRAPVSGESATGAAASGGQIAGDGAVAGAVSEESNATGAVAGAQAPGYVALGTAPCQIQPHGTCVWSMLMLPDHTLACGGGNGEIRLCRWTPDACVPRLATDLAGAGDGDGGYVAGHGGYVAAGAVVDGRAAAAAPAQVPAMAEQVATLRGHTDAVRALTL